MALTDQLISFYELEEASGTRADSVVGSANDLADINTVTQNTGKVGNCAEFTSANSEELTHADHSSLRFGGGVDFTLVAWVRSIGASSYAPVITKDAGGSEREFDLRIGANGTNVFSVRMFATGGDRIAVASNFGAVTDNVFYFVVVTYLDSTKTLSISVNDGTANTVDTVTSPLVSVAEFSVGGRDAPAYFDGRIDQVGKWSRVLSGAEITELYNSGNGLSYAAMAGGGGGFVAFPHPRGEHAGMMVLGGGINE